MDTISVERPLYRRLRARRFREMSAEIRTTQDKLRKTVSQALLLYVVRHLEVD